MTEHDRIGDLHHGGFEVHGEQHALCLGVFDLLGDEFAQGTDVHERAVKHFACLQGQFLFQNRDLSGLIDKLDLYIAGLLHGDGFFAVVKIAGSHMRYMGLRFRAPGTHLDRMFFGVFLYRLGRPSVGVTFPQDRVYGASQTLGISCMKLFLCVGFRLFGIIREFVALLLQFLDGSFQLRDRSTDIGQLDDIGFRLLGELTQFGQIIRHSLTLRQIVGKVCDNSSGNGDIPCFNDNAGCLCECIDDRE